MPSAEDPKRASRTRAAPIITDAEILTLPVPVSNPTAYPARAAPKQNL